MREYFPGGHGPEPENLRAERVPTEHEIESYNIRLYRTPEEAVAAQRGLMSAAEEIVPVSYQGEEYFVRYLDVYQHGREVPTYICVAPDGFGLISQRINRDK